MPSILQVEGLSKRFGSLQLLHDVSFGLAQGDKVGLIAPNGSGKTTLLNILAGREDYEAGQIVFRKDLRVGYLEQSPQYPAGTSVRQAMQLNPGNELEAVRLLTRLELTDLDRPTEALSGGQLKRLALAKALLDAPELLILDEPTNHLDLATTEWLEAYLARSTLSLLMVTHDRYFLDRVCNQILEIDRQKMYAYKGNYSYYLEKRQERLDAQDAETDRARNLMRKELDWMRRQPQARGTKAKSRIDAFYELERKARRQAQAGTVDLSNGAAAYIGSKIFEAKDISKRFGDLCILEHFNYTFARYEKMGIVGNNGAGKTTFLRLLLGEEPLDGGNFDIGQTVRFGYYSQQGLSFNEKAKVIDIVQDIAEYVELDGHKVGVSQFLNYFLFPPEKQHSYVAKLSGGERRRLYLCTVLMRNPNFLVLDEPTNDLDIVTLNVLEDYLSSFKGCLIVVSHDRYFMDKVVDHLLVFHGCGRVQDFPGNYTQYRLWKEAREEEEKAAKEAAPRREKAAPQRPARQSDEKRKLTFKERREWDALEGEIDALEKEKTALETELSSGTLPLDELRHKSERIAKVMEETEAKTTRWLELSEWA
ncbi:MAG: ABC-F family ATP-binding cassette domain-containing protein [Tannerella sp.]|jgi:ATP-binding cassette subfamily F protein uup|nr:ABC-F family ATP-binding cassette domain-containing protein [Tannerella sp.]